MQQPHSPAVTRVPRPLPGTWVAGRVRALPAWVWVAGLTLLAAGLRTYHLGAESFWFDEADIIRQAQAPLGTLLLSFTHAGENGPLYTLLLHFWILLRGTGESAVRTLPLLLGTATVPLIYYMGKRLLSRELGLVAAALLAVSPFHIWYSQDAKMYTLVVLVTLGSTTLYLEALEKGLARWWAAYVLATWIALFAHSLAILILGAQLLATPLLWPRAPRDDVAAYRLVAQRRRRWAIALLVLFVPFLPIAWERLYAFLVGNVAGNAPVTAQLWDMLSVLFVKFALNRAEAPWEAAGALVAGGLFSLGLLPWRRPDRQAWAFLAVLWVAPIGLFYLLNLKVPLFEPRYLIIVLPYYLLLVAAGLLRLSRAGWPLAGAALLLFVALDGVALAQINYSPQPQKEQWRQALDYVRQHVRLRDVIIVHPGYLKTAVDLYYAPSCDVPVVPVEAIPYLNTANFGTRELTDWLKTAITDHERVWLITSPDRTNKDDPEGKVLQFFEGQIWPEPRYYQFDVQKYIGVEIHGYAFNGQPHSWYPKPVYPQPVAYAGGFNFAGSIYEMRDRRGDQINNATWLPVTLYWRFDRPPVPAQDYIIALRLLDARGKEWAAYDQAPLNGYRPTPTFGTDEIIDYADLFIPGNAPPGPYHLTVQVWPRCSNGTCWDAARPREHAGQPLAVVHGLGTAPGATTLTLAHPIQVQAWQPCP
ncbi:MAG TPA: glycosyltransferase family 39 protein [Chloroflexia bacterium]|nr:glycosyltransferase family 39 protein [Chloroflexia bacterium]